MTEPSAAALLIGEQLSVGISVRGSRATEAQAIALGQPRLDEWHGQQVYRLPEKSHFDASDAVSQKADGVCTVTRTLRVVADEDEE